MTLSYPRVQLEQKGYDYMQHKNNWQQLNLCSMEVIVREAAMLANSIVCELKWFSTPKNTFSLGNWVHCYSFITMIVLVIDQVSYKGNSQKYLIWIHQSKCFSLNIFSS